MSLRRIDQVLLEYFPELSRSKIQTLIEKEKVIFLDGAKGWVPVKKPGIKIDHEEFPKESFEILQDEEMAYVSRGALKLKEVLEEFELSVQGSICLDAGLSTGGFSEVLINRGAEKILGLDVGTGQLAKSLREHPKLSWHDKVNVRNPIPEEILQSFFQEQPPLFDLIVIDVSFISLTKVVPTLAEYLKPNGHLVALIKPQFELTRKDLNRQGVVKDDANLDFVQKKIEDLFKEVLLDVKGIVTSPIKGDNGNQEFLILGMRP